MVDVLPPSPAPGDRSRAAHGHAARGLGGAPLARVSFSLHATRLIVSRRPRASRVDLHGDPFPAFRPPRTDPSLRDHYAALDTQGRRELAEIAARGRPAEPPGSTDQRRSGWVVTGPSGTGHASSGVGSWCVRCDIPPHTSRHRVPGLRQPGRTPTRGRNLQRSEKRDDHGHDYRRAVSRVQGRREHLLVLQHRVHRRVVLLVRARLDDHDRHPGVAAMTPGTGQRIKPTRLVCPSRCPTRTSNESTIDARERPERLRTTRWSQ